MKKVLSLFKRKKIQLENRVLKIQKGDDKDRNDVIEEYMPFIIKSISQITNRYIETENDEEYSIGLEAFNEAIDRYEKEKGGFLSFAKLIIKSRLIDKQRKKSIDFVPMEKEDEEGNIIEENLSTQDFTRDVEAREDIEEFKQSLLDFGIEFEDLLESYPKHYDARQRAVKVAHFIIRDEELRSDFYRKKTLPSTRISRDINISLKTIKRNRKFIIAAAIALDSDAGILRDYVLSVEGGVDFDIQRESS